MSLNTFIYKPYQNILLSKIEIYNTGIKIKKIFDNYNIILKELTILDIGCGNGFFEFSLSQYVKQITGIDISKYMIKDAIQNNKHFNYKNINFLCNNINFFTNFNKYNLILFSYSLHLIHEFNILKKIVNENIKYILIIEPNKEFITDELNIKNKKFNSKKYNIKQNKIKITKDYIKKIFNKYKKYKLLYKNINDYNSFILYKNTTIL
tara:strand:- start:1057 stop:1680 length:624 start_codon:yes stop_codon:yes gene_type:complete